MRRTRLPAPLSRSTGPGDRPSSGRPRQVRFHQILAWCITPNITHMSRNILKYRIRQSIMLFFVHLRIVLPRLIEREGLLYLDFFHVLRKSAVFEEYLNSLESLYVKHDPNLSAAAGYDILSFDIDRRELPQPAHSTSRIIVLTVSSRGPSPVWMISQRIVGFTE